MAVLGGDAGVQDHFDKGRRAAVHDGKFGRIHLDLKIDDPQSRRRGQDVFRCLHLDAVHTYDCREQRRADVFDQRVYSHTAVNILPNEDNP